MLFKNAYRRGDELTARVKKFRQPLFVIAHQDDELNFAGLITRLGPKTKFVWLTNGDGLYQESDLTPEKYGDLRMAEAKKSVAAAGIAAKNTVFLKFSEVEIYRHLSELHEETGDRRRKAGGRRSEVGGLPDRHRTFFDGMRAAVRAKVLAINPDVVFTLAWQGGQPEHDLCHFFTMLALRDLARYVDPGRRPHDPFAPIDVRLRLVPSNLTCQLDDHGQPEFGWTCLSGQGQSQSAYQVLVASTRERLDADAGDLWDSGKVPSARSEKVPYGGAPLRSGGSYWWKVRVWNQPTDLLIRRFRVSLGESAINEFSAEKAGAYSKPAMGCDR